MPKKHPKAVKIDALIQLSYGHSVSTVHFATGIPMRTLYRWRAEHRQQSAKQMARKTSDSAAYPPHNPSSCHKPADSRQSTPDSCQNEPQNDQQLPQTPHTDGDQSQQPANADAEDFTFIREQLMKYARQMAADLQPDDPDINRRTLALARVLDRIQWIDNILPDHSSERVIRIEYYYDGKVQDLPPWHGASQGKARMTTEDFMPNRRETAPSSRDDADQPADCPDPSLSSPF